MALNVKLLVNYYLVNKIIVILVLSSTYNYYFATKIKFKQYDVSCCWDGAPLGIICWCNALEVICNYNACYFDTCKCRL